MKKLYLHIGSHKTGTTSIQNVFHQNRSELKNQGFLYPGNESNHHKFFFSTESRRENWPRQFRNADTQVLNKSVKDYFSTLERDLESHYSKQIISTEFLFIDKKDAIDNTIHYLQNFFSEVAVYVFVRNPADYFASAQQQMIKARSYVKSPVDFRYNFKNVIEAWKNVCKVHVIEYSSKDNSSKIFCDKTGLNYNRLSQNEQRNNSTLSVEQMVLLEKIQANMYRDKENKFKPHLGIIQNINAKFTTKPVLKKEIKKVIQSNHREDLEWLYKHFSIDFRGDDIKVQNGTSFQEPEYDKHASVKDIYQVDEKSVELYEVAVMDLLLKKFVK